MIRLKKILVATDFRRIGDGARLRARADAQLRRGVDVLHVVADALVAVTKA